MQLQTSTTLNSGIYNLQYCDKLTNRSKKSVPGIMIAACIEIGVEYGGL